MEQPRPSGRWPPLILAGVLSIVLASNACMLWLSQQRREVLSVAEGVKHLFLQSLGEDSFGEM